MERSLQFVFCLSAREETGGLLWTQELGSLLNRQAPDSGRARASKNKVESD